MTLSKKDIMLAEMTLAIRDGKEFTIWVQHKDLPKEEEITNQVENLESKISYYDVTYDNNLKMYTNPDIKITRHRAGNVFNQQFIPRGILKSKLSRTFCSLYS